MATESRIGIAFGFVIVAIASVYFIYGSDRSDGDLLLTDEKVAKTDAKKDVTQPSTKSTTKKTNTTPNAANSRRSASSHSKGSRNNASKPAVNKAPNNSRLANRGNQKPTSATKPTPRRNKPNPVLARNNNTVPTRRDPMRITKGADEAAKSEQEADATNPITRIARNQADRTPFRGPTPLNSNASKSLVDATEKNLKEAEATKADEAKPEEKTKPVVRRTPNRSQPMSDRLADPVRAARARARRVGPDSNANTPPRRSTKPVARGTDTDATGKTKRPDAGAMQVHTVASGDTLSEISMRYYDTSRKVDEILAANPEIKSATALKIGQKIKIPAADAKAAPATEETIEKIVAKMDKPNVKRSTKKVSTRTYTVKKGDTFYSIAESVYGSTSRWKDIFKANKRVVKNKPKNLKPGMVLEVPA